MPSERQHPDMTIEEELGHAMIARAEMEMMWAESHDEVQRLRTRLDALTAERDALRGWQAGQTHYVGCWREHRRCALTTIDFEAARREHAELALREAVAELNRLREGHDDERR